MDNYFSPFFSLIDFQPIKTKFSSPQKKTLNWLVKAHAQAEAIKRNQPVDSDEMKIFSEKLKQRLLHVSCSESQIEKRGHSISDLLHHDWNSMEIYCLNENETGAHLGKRLKVFGDITLEIFKKIYDQSKSRPDDLIHVTCTGYTAPSSAQKIISKKNWEKKTTVTHAYHMGCYGSIPALRMGCGFLACGKNLVDVVHTEVCSLHTNPSLHTSDKLVAQSLFADGFIKYSIVKNDTIQTPHLNILALHEQIIDSSLEAMTWTPSFWGFDFFIAKEIPVLIKKSISLFLENLCKKTKLDLKTLKNEAIFAIHPGGPKIINQVQNILGLKDQQLRHSIKILKSFGNMSSATLPYIWHEILNDPGVGNDTYIISLGFGPGLTVCGNILKKAK